MKAVFSTALLALCVFAAAGRYDNTPVYYNPSYLDSYYAAQPAGNYYSSAYFNLPTLPPYYANRYFEPYAVYLRKPIARYGHWQYAGRLALSAESKTVGTVWRNGVLLRDEYEGYAQPPFPTEASAAASSPSSAYAYYYATPTSFPAAPAPGVGVREVNLRISHAGGFSPNVIVMNREETVRILASTDFPSHMHGVLVGAPYYIDQRVYSTSTAAPNVIQFVAHTRGTFTIRCGCGSEHYATGGTDFTGTLVVN